MVFNIILTYGFWFINPLIKVAYLIGRKAYVNIFLIKYTGNYLSQLSFNNINLLTYVFDNMRLLLY